MVACMVKMCCVHAPPSCSTAPHLPMSPLQFASLIAMRCYACIDTSMHASILLCMHRYFYACIYSVFRCYPCDSLAPVMLPPLPPRLLPTLSEVKGRVT